MRLVGDTVSSFGGLAHRCEACGSVKGISFINSSIDTTPSRTRATLEALARPVHLILGGRGKGLSPEPMTETIKKYAKSVAVYGEVREEFFSYLKEVGIYAITHEKFDDAVFTAYSKARPGEVVLLSPAATAYGEFLNFEERGDRFRHLVSEIK